MELWCRSDAWVAIQTSYLGAFRLGPNFPLGRYFIMGQHA